MSAVSKTQISDRFDPGICNALDTVEDAHRAVRQGDYFIEYMGAARRLFHAHNVDSTFGICLLHRHFLCEDGECMIEREECIDGEMALVTRPVAEHPSQRGATPVSWAFQNGMLHPLAYSTDHTAVKHYQPAKLTAQFLNEFSALTESSPIGRWLGLAVCNRTFYDRPNPGQGAIEYPSAEERANIVFVRDRTEYAGSSIETSWSLAGVPSGSLQCKVECLYDANQSHYKHHTPR